MVSIWNDYIFKTIPRIGIATNFVIRKGDRVFSRSEILDKLWEIDRVIAAGDRTIRTHITNLRHKLKEAGLKEDCIETVYGMGYRLRGKNKNNL